MQIGIPMDSDYRIRSGIKYALLVASLNGNTCVQKENLIDYVKAVLEVDSDRIEDNIIALNVSSEIHILVENHVEWVFLEPLYKAEKNVADKLIALRDFSNMKYIKSFEKELKKSEEKIDIELSQKQHDAIKQINESNVCIITGGPGTGKTTIIKCVIDLYKSKGKKVVLCAPTGRAAKRMSETTGEEAKTIHRLLEIGKFDEDKLGSIDQEVAPVDCDVLVVDEIESSMHPLLTRHLIEMVQDAAINTNHAQLIFTTHDTGLLDLTLLRRDQIWFAEKNEKTMQTDIYALTEFSPRKGENISKGYLQGRYGAIPHMKKAY